MGRETNTKIVSSALVILGTRNTQRSIQLLKDELSHKVLLQEAKGIKKTKLNELLFIFKKTETQSKLKNNVILQHTHIMYFPQKKLDYFFILFDFWF